MKRVMGIVALLLMCMLTGTVLWSCSGKTGDTPDTAPDTESTEATDAASDTASVTEPETLAETREATDTEPVSETQPETEEPAWIPPAEASLDRAANVAIGCPVITNGAKDGSNQSLTDGDPATAWRTGYLSDESRRTYPYEAVIDLTRSYSICGLVIRPAAGATNGMLDRFRVEVSVDGISYIEVSDGSGVTASEEGMTLTLDTEARFVRLISTDLGERTAYGLEISEVEVLSDITSYDNLLPNKRALVMQPGATDTLSATYRISPEASGTISFFSSNSRVVSVEETTGKVTALADGEAILYVTDGVNATAIPVTVNTPDPAYRVATFYLANHGENTREVFSLLKESGITFIENCRAYDTYGNVTTEYLRVMAADFGLTLSIADPSVGQFLSMSDEEIRAVAAKYKNLPGYGGLYIVDEPLNPNAYVRVYQAMLDEDPFCLPHLNLFPPMGQIADYHGYVTDWIALVGGENLRTLSYDNYPYGPTENTFHEWVYDSMDEIRRSALQYNQLNTGYYIHSMGIYDAYRVPTHSEILYHTALGVAYGMKDFKHFVWFTPPYSGSGEHFITGILTSEMEKSEIYEGVKAANTMLHTLSPVLANTDSVEVYHFRGQGGEKIPDDFCVTTQTSPIVLSVLVDRTTGQQYLVVVNKRMNQDADISLRVRDSALSSLWDVTSGEEIPLVIANGKVTLEIPAGGLCVIKLPEGYDARADQSVNDGTSESLLVGIGASVSTSASASNGTYAYMLTDGQRTATGWSSNYDADTAWILYDLKTEKTFNRVDIYPLEGSYEAFPRALSVWVSSDGESYRKVAAAEGIGSTPWGSLTFADTTARYIRISVDEMVNVGKPFAAIGEIEVYADTGSIPSMPTFTLVDEESSFDGFYLTPEQAGVVLVSYDAMMADGEMLVNGSADVWLDARDNTLAASSSLVFHGWAGFSQAIVSYGYRIDEEETVWNAAFKVYTEDAVLNAGGAHAARFQIRVDLSGLTGTHTVTFFAKLGDGTVVLLNKPLTVTAS